MAEKHTDVSVYQSSEEDRTLTPLTPDNSESGVIDVVLPAALKPNTIQTANKEVQTAVDIQTSDKAIQTVDINTADEVAQTEVEVHTANTEVQTVEIRTADKEVQTEADLFPSRLSASRVINVIACVVLMCVCLWFIRSLAFIYLNKESNTCTIPTDPANTVSSELSTCRLKVTQHEKTQTVLTEQVNRLNKTRLSLQDEVGSFKFRTKELEEVTRKLNSIATKLHYENQRLETRLGELMKTVVDDNDDFTKLEDYSKFNIEKEFKQLYDNEYTRAVIEMQKLGLNLGTEKLTKYFLDILKMSDNLCRNYSSKHLNSIRQSITTLSLDIHLDHERLKYSQESSSVKDETDNKETANMTIDNKMTKLELSQIFDVKRSAALRFQEPFVKILSKVVASEFNVEPASQPKMVKYINKCLQLCWMMNMHLHPVFIDFVEISDTAIFDTDTFKSYLSSGKYIQYVAWPPLYSYNGGKLLLKGIAEGRD